MTDEVWYRLESILAQRAISRGAESLNDVEAAFAFVRAFQVELNNGGFWAFFYNSTGDFPDATVRGARAIGARSAEILERAIAVYVGDRRSFASDEDRRKWVEQHGGDSTPAADRLNKEFFDTDEGLMDLLEPYLAEHMDEVRIDDTEAATATSIGDDWRQCPACADAWQQRQSERFDFCPSCRTFTVLRSDRP